MLYAHSFKVDETYGCFLYNQEVSINHQVFHCVFYQFHSQMAILDSHLKIW